MERLLKVNENKTIQMDIKTFESIITRTQLANELAHQSYGGNRDMFLTLGYVKNLWYIDYLSRYLRQDIAKAIIDRPIKATWQGDLVLEETKKAGITDFEAAWKTLNDQFKLKGMFARVDRLAGIGRYGILLLGLDDCHTPGDLRKPINPKRKNKLIYLKAFGEGTAKILQWVTDTGDPRFGKPEVYNCAFQDIALAASVVLEVHHTRVIHVVDDLLESDIEGLPRLEVVFNRLMDLEKIVGGDAEMFWRSARPGYTGMVAPEFQMTDQFEKDLKNQFDEYENGLRRFLVNEGVEVKALTQQIADPIPHVEAQLKMISAVTGIPLRVLTGSERGELASTQDSNEWITFVQNRRDDFAELRIVRPFVDRMLELGVLPAPTSSCYDIRWSNLFGQSESDRATIGVKRAQAIQAYSTNPIAESIFPPEAFMELCLGLDEGQIDLVMQMIQKTQGKGIEGQPGLIDLPAGGEDTTTSNIPIKGTKPNTAPNKSWVSPIAPDNAPSDIFPVADVPEKNAGNSTNFSPSAPLMKSKPKLPLTRIKK